MSDPMVNENSETQVEQTISIEKVAVAAVDSPQKSETKLPAFDFVPGTSWKVALVTTVITAIYYAVLLRGPVRFPWLERYCLCHPVAIVTVWLFVLTLVTFYRKSRETSKQSKLVKQSRSCFKAIDSQLEDGQAEARSIDARVEWLKTMWLAQSTAICRSWIGRRLLSLLQSQSNRGSVGSVEEDLANFASMDSDEQYESYGMVRTATWAMPMLGFLGTVLGISETLGTMDMELLASGSQEALNKMTAGLYVAFDTTAIALALTMVSIFIQHFVHRRESKVLQAIDRLLTQSVVRWLPSHESAIASDADRMAIQLVDNLKTTLTTIVASQAELWRSTIDEARQYWSSATGATMLEANRSLVEAINSSLDRHSRYAEKAESDGAAQIEARWQQWQMTLSEQAKVLQASQQQLQQQGQLLCELIEKSGALQRIEQSMDNNLYRLTDIDRFHEAAVCLTEQLLSSERNLNATACLARTLRVDHPTTFPRARKCRFASTVKRVLETRCMTRAVTKRDTLAPSLFPFLAVLLCTVGSLIVILVVAVFQAQASAKSTIEEEVGERQEFADELEVASMELAARREQQVEALAEQRSMLSHFESAIDRAQQEIEQLEKQLSELESGKVGANATDIESEVVDLQKKISDARDRLEEKKKEQANKKPAYAIVPYGGANGTTRRPIYLECTRRGSSSSPRASFRH